MIAKTQQTQAGLDNSRKALLNNMSGKNVTESNFTTISRPGAETVINKEPSISLPIKSIQKPSGENKDFFKRVAGLFGKAADREGSPPSKTET